MLYRKPVDGSWASVDEVNISGGKAYTNYYPCAFGDNMFVATDDKGTYLVEAGKRITLSSTKYDILNIFGSYVYYKSSGDAVTLGRFDLSSRNNLNDGEITTENASTASKTHALDNYHFIDFDNQRIYVFAEYTAENGDENYYLNYINRTTRTERFVGKFENNDIPAKPKQDEDYGKDESVKYIPHID